MLYGADGTPHGNQPTALLEFHGSAGGTPPHSAPLDMGAIHERLVADRPVAVPVATPDQPMPPGGCPQNVPEVTRGRPFAASTDDVHGQAVAVPGVMGGGTLGDRPTAIVPLAAKAVQERLPFVGPQRLKDDRRVFPHPHIGHDPPHRFPEARGQQRHVRLDGDFSGREGEFMRHFWLRAGFRA